MLPICFAGDLDWEWVGAPYGQHWLLIQGLMPSVLYEMRVVAKNSEEKGSPETSSRVRVVLIGHRRGQSCTVVMASAH